MYRRVAVIPLPPPQPKKKSGSCLNLCMAVTAMPPHSCSAFQEIVRYLYVIMKKRFAEDFGDYKIRTYMYKPEPFFFFPIGGGGGGGGGGAAYKWYLTVYMYAAMYMCYFVLILLTCLQRYSCKDWPSPGGHQTIQARELRQHGLQG